MKALTVCQPYADLLLLPSSDPRYKRTENRTWQRAFRGPLLIHAGKSRDWIEPSEDPSLDRFGFRIADFTFGAIVGVVTVIDCLAASQVEKKYRRLQGHQHIQGPFCFVVCDVRRFAAPIPYRGGQGLFDVPDALVQEAIADYSPRALRGFPESVGGRSSDQ